MEQNQSDRSLFEKETLTLREWTVVVLIASLPGLGIVGLLLMAFDRFNSKLIKTFSRAALIGILTLAVVVTGAYFLFRHLEGQTGI